MGNPVQEKPAINPAECAQQNARNPCNRAVQVRAETRHEFPQMVTNCE
jgi:hypothetical protein